MKKKVFLQNGDWVSGDVRIGGLLSLGGFKAGVSQESGEPITCDAIVPTSEYTPARGVPMHLPESPEVSVGILYHRYSDGTEIPKGEFDGDVWTFMCDVFTDGKTGQLYFVIDTDCLDFGDGDDFCEVMKDSLVLRAKLECGAYVYYIATEESLNYFKDEMHKIGESYEVLQ